MRKMTYLFCCAFVALIALAAFKGLFSSKGGYEERVARATIASERSCPLSSETIASARVELLSICSAYGLEAYAHASQYPDLAVRLVSNYGDLPEFKEAIMLSSDALPIIAYFMDNGSKEFQARESASETLEGLWSGKGLRFKLANLTPEQFGRMGILELNERRYEMLAEFEIVNGVASRKQGARFLYGVKNFMLGNALNYEAILVRGERPPTWKEAGMAALDAAVVIGGISSVSKLAKAARAAEADASIAGKTAKLGEAGGAALIGVTRIGRALAPAIPVAIAYAAITHPILFASAGGWVAEKLGYDPFLGVVLACFAMAIVASFALSALWKLLSIFGIPFRLARWAYLHAKA